MKWIALLLATAWSGFAFADGVWVGRGGLSAGTYKFDEQFTDKGCCPGYSFQNSDSNTTYGVTGGSTLVWGQFFIDGGLEYSAYAKQQDLDGDGSDDSVYRTDGITSVGAFIGDRWSAFGGYRSSTIGDGFFSDVGGNSQSGPFVGGLASFRPGDRISLSASLVYNKLKLLTAGASLDDLDLAGISAKLQMNIVGTPHSVLLRFQRFTGDLQRPGDFAYEFTDTYLNLGYQLTFDIKSW